MYLLGVWLGPLMWSRSACSEVVQRYRGEGGLSHKACLMSAPTWGGSPFSAEACRWFGLSPATFSDANLLSGQSNLRQLALVTIIGLWGEDPYFKPPWPGLVISSPNPSPLTDGLFCDLAVHKCPGKILVSRVL